MAKPLSSSRALRAFREFGLDVREVGNWTTHNRNHRGRWGEVHGVMLHHTASRGTKGSVDLCRNGYEGLPGPLCHGVIDKQGVLWLVGWGRTNHAGWGDPDVLRAVIGESKLPTDDQASVDGNARFYGFECINMGDGHDPWPAVQIEAMIRASAALVKAHGWGTGGDTSVIGHKEWQPGKPDPRGVDMDAIRRKVESLVGGGGSGTSGSKPGCPCRPCGPSGRPSAVAPAVSQISATKTYHEFW